MLHLHILQPKKNMLPHYLVNVPELPSPAASYFGVKSRRNPTLSFLIPYLISNYYDYGTMHRNS
jgi:hypothetical protein